MWCDQPQNPFPESARSVISALPLGPKVQPCSLGRPKYGCFHIVHSRALLSRSHRLESLVGMARGDHTWCARHHAASWVRPYQRWACLQVLGPRWQGHQVLTDQLLCAPPTASMANAITTLYQKISRHLTTTKTGLWWQVGCWWLTRTAFVRYLWMHFEIYLKTATGGWLLCLCE